MKQTSQSMSVPQTKRKKQMMGRNPNSAKKMYSNVEQGDSVKFFFINKKLCQTKSEVVK
uniref:Uncharacterized protein n=1 Tax=Arion vulgaris TaxID=1028688 RepID=A0A0B6ZTR5_9EUPU